MYVLVDDTGKHVWLYKLYNSIYRVVFWKLLFKKVINSQVQ